MIRNIERMEYLSLSLYIYRYYIYMAPKYTYTCCGPVSQLSHNKMLAKNIPGNDPN